MAILDRHTLKNLYFLGVIDNVHSSFSKKGYLEIENRMMKFAIKYLDLILWYKET